LFVAIRLTGTTIEAGTVPDAEIPEIFLRTAEALELVYLLGEEAHSHDSGERRKASPKRLRLHFSS